MVEWKAVIKGGIMIMKEKKIIKGKSGVAFYEYTSWCHRYKILEKNGKVKYSKLKGFKTEKEAEKSYYEYEKRFLEQQREFYATVNKDISFKDYLIYWFENIYSERTETTTQMIGAYIIYNLILPSIEYDTKINMVTTDYLDQIIERASKLTESAGESARLIVLMAIKDAVIGGYITWNPALKTKKYRRKKPKIQVLGTEQLKRFLELAKNSTWYLEILLGLFCGLRKGEILGLKMEDIDIENKTIKIERQIVVDYQLQEKSGKVKGYKLIEREPKTKNSIRRIIVPNIIIEEVKKRIELIEKNKVKYKENYVDNHYISCTKTGTLHALTSLNKVLDDICQKLSLPHITVHGLRHMCATILLEQGASLAKIAAYLGHTSIHTTFEYYCEVMDEKEKILAFMNNIFSAEVGEINAK